MRNFVYLIGTTDDFTDIEDLKAEYFTGESDRNMSVYHVVLSKACVVTGYDTLEELATVIARGEAMSNGWCLDDTISCLLEA